MREKINEKLKNPMFAPRPKKQSLMKVLIKDLDLDVGQDGAGLGRVVLELGQANRHERDVVRVAAHLDLAILQGVEISYRHVVS